MARRLFDSLDQLLQRLELRPFRGDQSQHHHAIVGYLTERVKSPGSRIVVLKQQSLGANILEDGLGDEIIAAFDQPATALISPTKVKAEGYIREIRHERVVQLDTEFQPFIELPAPGLIKGAGFGIEQQGIVRRVDLDIGRAQTHQLDHFISENVDDVGEEALQGWIDTAGSVGRPEIREQARAGQRDLRNASSSRTQVGELLGSKMPFARQLPDDT